MSITRLPVVDDTGDGTSGTPITAAWWTQVQNMIDARWSVFGIAPSGIVNDMATNEADLVILVNTTGVTVTGLVAPANPAKTGKRLIVAVLGATPVLFAHNFNTSLPTSRLVHPGAANININVGGTISYVYVGATGGNVWLMTGATGVV